MVAVSVTIFLLYQVALRVFPYPAAWRERPAESTWISDRAGRPLATLVSDEDTLQQWIAEDQLGPYLAEAIIAVEDERFFDHGAVDIRSIGGAIVDDAKSLLSGHGIRRGASTITMQLQRLRDPQPRSLLNKVGQAFRAAQIERSQNKQSILLDYINRAPFGGNLIGAAAGSWRYFGKPLSALSLSQCALLAGLPQSPTALRPDLHPDRALARRNHVLDRLLATGKIDATAYRAARNEPVNARWLPLPQTQAAHGAMPTLVNAASKNGPGRWSVTLDRDVQKMAFAIVGDALSKLNDAGSAAAAAAVVLDVDSGECLASVSLGDRPGLDLTRRRRSTGSMLKPFIYARAFEGKLASANTMLNDTPLAWAGYEPRDFDHTFRGTIDAASALAESRNLPAMTLLSRVGVGAMGESLDRMGLTKIDRTSGLTMAVGGAEASAWELAGAYAALARGGMMRSPTILISGTAQPTRRVLTSAASLAVLAAISERDRTCPISAAAADLRAAWKTGTSSGSRDAWCAAVTPRRVVIVWIGNPSGAGDVAFTGIDAAAPIALNTLAAIDPGGEPFAPAATVNVKEQPIKSASMLTIVTPVVDQKFVVDPDVPVVRQQITFRAVGETGGRVWWFVDGVLVGETASDSVVWPPVGGRHTVRAVTETGGTRVIPFTVTSTGR